MKLKDENEDLNRSVVNLKVYKEKFVATNKEIVKIYRDKQNIVNEKFQLKNVSEKMEKGYLMAIDELNERLKHTLDTIRVLKRKYDVTHSEYKANRPPMPEDLKEQLSPIKSICRAIGFPLLEIGGVEADDVIATISTIQQQPLGCRRQGRSPATSAWRLIGVKDIGEKAATAAAAAA